MELPRSDIFDFEKVKNFINFDFKMRFTKDRDLISKVNFSQIQEAKIESNPDSVKAKRAPNPMMDAI